jgi:FolB domain-containing protein
MAGGILFNNKEKMDKVIIRDLMARGIIGINESERTNPQDILINITMEADTQKAGLSDDINDCINYRTVSKKALALAEKAERLTVEALANDIAMMVLEFEGVQGVCVRVEKPGAVRFSRSVGVEIERSK